MLRAHWEPFLSDFAALEVPEDVFADCGSQTVTFGDERTLAFPHRDRLDSLIKRLIPWRKGPFRLAGHFIDAEWRSDLKWDRLAPFVPSLAGLRVADIGCGNGYYMFRASAHGATKENPPEVILGFDPSEAFCLAFSLFQRFYRHSRLQYDLLGLEDMPSFPGFFDVALCLGVVYHQKEPLTALRQLKSCLKPGGLALVESLVYPGRESVAFFSPDRYAKAHNVYYVPTAECLAAWMKRSGFSRVEIVSESELTPVEQRRTALMPYESLTDFLSPESPGTTVEGYPAPGRAAVIGYA